MTSPMTAPLLELTIDGNRFNDILGFYAEINRVFMAGEDWQLGASLDALDDLLYGGYGAMKHAERIVLHWIAMDKSRADLGLDTTRRWLQEKLETGQFNGETIRAQLDALERGEGQTYFDIVMEILEAHKRRVDLVAG